MKVTVVGNRGTKNKLSGIQGINFFSGKSGSRTTPSGIQGILSKRKEGLGKCGNEGRIAI